MAGELVGVVNAKMTSEEIEGLGFAIPVDFAYQVASELIEYRYVRGRVTTGLTLVNATNSYTAIQYFGTSQKGVYVYESAFCEDLVYGDRILSANGETITSSDDLNAIVSGMAVGDTVTLTVVRNGKQISVELVLAEYVPDYVK